MGWENLGIFCNSLKCSEYSGADYNINSVYSVEPFIKINDRLCLFSGEFQLKIPMPRRIHISQRIIQTICIPIQRLRIRRPHRDIVLLARLAIPLEERAKL